ncbi:DUF6054 family protein [Bengtsoniella intestinalis]|uniref:DUF6054 family protein n=1 Tax=Bengtsoniella intestinalis TaxID=3073143 RepID=UPI00391F040D
MVKRTFKHNKVIQFNNVIQNLEQLGMSVEVEMEQTGQLTNLLIEKYFMRNSNVSCCAVSIYSHSPIEHDIIVMSGGSAQGMLFKFSWGADDEFLNDVCTALQE